jgi:hypothetical protein
VGTKLFDPFRKTPKTRAADDAENAADTPKKGS